MPRSDDTDPWAEQMQIELLRRAGPARRLELACQLSAFSWNAARAAIGRLHPHESREERDLRFLTHVYGEEIARDFIRRRRGLRRRAKS